MVDTGASGDRVIDGWLDVFQKHCPDKRSDAVGIEVQDYEHVQMSQGLDSSNMIPTHVSAKVPVGIGCDDWC